MTTATATRWYTKSQTTAPHYQGLVCDEETGATVAVTYHDEGAHKAQLIAAAPDLLEACRAAGLLLGDISHYVPDEEFDTEPNVNTVRHTIEAAIAKATGA